MPLLKRSTTTLFLLSAAAFAACSSTNAGTGPSGAGLADGGVGSSAEGGAGGPLACGPGNPVFLSTPVVAPGVGRNGVGQAAAADVNGDGKTDLIQQLVSSSGKAFAVTMNKGDGTFAEPVSYDGSVSALAVVDVNADGKPDVVYGVGSKSAVAVALNKGDGTFAAVVESPTLEVVIGLQAGDFNGDGKIDLAVNTQQATSADGFTIQLGNNDGTFAAPAAIAGASAASGQSTIGAADFDGDGNLDIAVLVGGGPCVLHNRGGAQFDPPACSKGSENVVQREALLIADMNGDGKPDLVEINFDVPKAVDVFLNQAGAFPSVITSPVPPGPIPYGGTVGDFDGDGKIDVMTFGEGDAQLVLKRGKGDGSFVDEFQFFSAGAGGLGGAYILSGDFLGNGHLGVAVVDLTLGFDVIEASCRPKVIPAVPPALGLPAKKSVCTRDKVQFAPAASVTLGGNSNGIVAADLNGDGKADLAMQPPSSGAVVYALSNGDGTFAAPKTVSGGSSGGFTVGDIDGDGKLDLVFPEGEPNSSGDIGFALNLGTGFGPAQRQNLNTNMIRVQMADMNNDGHVDAVMNTQNGFTGGNFTIAFNAGSAPFFVGRGARYEGYSFERRYRLVDLDGDGQLDVVWLATTKGLCAVRNVGNGNFSKETCYPAFTNADPTDIAVGDVNGDGKPDVVSANKDRDHSANLWLGNGDGTFKNDPNTTFKLNVFASRVELYDFDNDGKLDVLLYDAVDHFFALSPGNGDGTFAASPNRYGAGAEGDEADIAIGDFLGNGLVGFAAIDRGNASVVTASCKP